MDRAIRVAELNLNWRSRVNHEPTNAQALMALYTMQQARCYPANTVSVCSENSTKGCAAGIRRENRSTSFRLYEHGQKHGCLQCGKPLAVKSTGDHLLALHLGGPDGAQNYVPLCGRCNSSKGARDFFAWWQKKGRRMDELPVDVLCAYARLWWQKHERDGTLDEPAPAALVAAVIELRDSFPPAMQRALLHARARSTEMAA